MAFPLLAILAVVSAGVAAQNQRNAAKTQAFEIERQAEEERISSEGRELERRQKLNKVLAANAVGQATSGMTGEGTPQSIALSNAKTASLSEGLEGLSDRLRQAQLKRQAANTRSAGNIQASSTLLKGVSQAEQLS